MLDHTVMDDPVGTLEQGSCYHCTQYTFCLLWQVWRSPSMPKEWITDEHGRLVCTVLQAEPVKGVQRGQ